jgi:hypothetical protein
MTMNKNNIATGSGSGNECGPRRYRDVWPSEAAVAELTWFFNQAEIDMDGQSNMCARLAGCTIETLDEVERRAEARHSAGKIYDRLKRLRETDALLLSGLFLERYWSDAVDAALPAGLAGAAAVCPRVRVEHLRALARAQTRTKDARAFVEEVVRKGRPQLVAEWRAELELYCAIAVHAYERVRGDGPSVVPSEEDGQ